LIITPASLADAPGIAVVHVAAWRSTYANLLPADYLSGMSMVRHAAMHHAAIAAGRGVLVARADEQVVGFCTVGKPRTPGLADGEIETLYVLDDWQGQGIGRRLMQAGAGLLEQRGCGSAFLWVLQDNPSRWFYERLGGRPKMGSTTGVAGKRLAQTAYVWNPIGMLTGASATR
jgi:ribosomal protein S18 acetylase RimI-like enzyme